MRRGKLMSEKNEREIEIIDRQEEENGDYSFTFIMTFPPAGDAR
jgi:hypothetical protein